MPPPSSKNNTSNQFDSRRDFLKKAALFAGSTGMAHVIPDSIKKALSIHPDPGTTYRDAEHVVLLMQENRSFDHVFGSLQGVRGFNDPRAIRLPNGNPVWLQSNERKETYAPFRMDIKDSKITWMGALPHSWESQVDARNSGRYDEWLTHKASGHEDYRQMPLTLGYYTREDLPFYYALADAFTISDHHFCSSLTATTPNRLYYWTGTVRENQIADSPANIKNNFVDYEHNANWETFPEILEKAGISWKVYQNELSISVGLEGEAETWLANFTNNPLEWFSQFHVREHKAHVKHIRASIARLEKELADLNDAEERVKKREELKELKAYLNKHNEDAFERYPKIEQNIHRKAFTTNADHPDYHKTSVLTYTEGHEERQVEIPKSDPLYQFRKDVEKGTLPTVSWLIGSQRFSDHPSSPWYGAWYVSEVLDILTKNPEIWKKTIFILTYDENDGYFDHLAPFTAPDPEDRSSGFCSEGLDTSLEYVTKSQAEKLKGAYKDPSRVSPIGLGYRVPFIVASPWSRGGKVNSQITDNTSVLMFLEHFLTEKTGKKIHTDCISSWRRIISGDLTSLFEPYRGEETALPPFVEQEPFVKGIYNARFKSTPTGFKKLEEEEIAAAREGHKNLSFMPKQEPGTKPANPIPYELYVDGRLSPSGNFEIEMKASDTVFGKQAKGAPFAVYNGTAFELRNYTIKAGDQLTDHWKVDAGYHFRIHGPNGFYRAYKGELTEKELQVHCRYEKKKLFPNQLTGNIALDLQGEGEIEIIDNAYGQPGIEKTLTGENKTLILDLNKSDGWYDFTVRYKDHPAHFQRFAGHVETGRPSITDPHMGRVF